MNEIRRWMETGSHRKRHDGNIKSLEEDKLLKIEMIAELYNVLNELGINFDDFSKGEKMFEKDRDRFMKMIEMMGGNAEIVDKDSE